MRTAHSRLAQTLVAVIVLGLGLTKPASAQEIFNNLSDLVPDRCFSAPLSTTQDHQLTVGIETGTYLLG